MHDQPKATAQIDLHIVRDFFAARTCCEVVNDMRRSPAGAALTYGKGAGSVDERIRRAIQVSPSAQTLAYVTRRLEEERQNLQNHFGIALNGYEQPQFLCYRVGDFFVAHQDGNTGLVNLNTDRARRVSITIFLNDQSADRHEDTYDGGSLVFSDWRTGSRHEVAGVAGTLVAFRSETTHEVTPITRGKRYAIVTWYSQSGLHNAECLNQALRSP